MEQDLARLRLLAKVRGGDKAGEAKKKGIYWLLVRFQKKDKMAPC
jgi:hypothetical protein